MAAMDANNPGPAARGGGAERDPGGHDTEMLHLEALTRLAGGVAHDFNNILTAIRGGVSFALEDLPEDHPVRPDLDQVVVAANRAVELTRRLLAFSRRQPARLAVHDLAALIESLAPKLRKLAGDEVEVRIATPSDAAPSRIDSSTFEQALGALIENARDAMSDGGTVRIALEEVGGELRVAVTDTGTGIAPEIRARVFEPYFTTSRGGLGKGLGLAIVYGVIRQAGGRVAVEDHEGSGARVAIYLPRVAGDTG